MVANDRQSQRIMLPIKGRLGNPSLLVECERVSFFAKGLSNIAGIRGGTYQNGAKAQLLRSARNENNLVKASS
jgi:hypothetical protein